MAAPVSHFNGSGAMAPRVNNRPGPTATASPQKGLARYHLLDLLRRRPLAERRNQGGQLVETLRIACGGLSIWLSAPIYANRPAMVRVEVAGHPGDDTMHPAEIPAADRPQLRALWRNLQGRIIELEEEQERVEFLGLRWAELQREIERVDAECALIERAAGI